MERAHQFAQKAVELDPNLPQARAQLGLVLVWRRQHDASIASFERAIALNPHFSDWRFAEALALAGEPGRALEVLEAYFRIDPFYPTSALHYMGSLSSCSKGILKLSFQYSTASPARRLGGLHAKHLLPRMRTRDGSRAHGRKLKKYCASSPTIRSKSIGAGPLKFTEDAKHYFDGLRRAGIPDR
ncbi:MAG: hypothetical protein WAO08_07580 [Hyphomicrobiaceae bacterium]